MNVAVIVFPGSNCEIDCHKAIEDTIGQPVEYVWHTENDLDKFDCLIIPGGFSYGDYLRTGAIAQFAPVMQAVVEAAKRGKYILGICNGFQILLEAGLLPGAMLRNKTLKFHCQPAQLRVVNNKTPFTTEYGEDEIVSIPIAHGEGNYYCNETTLARLRANNQIVFRYERDNPNGSVDDIAGICSEDGRIVGMMPHPERAVNALIGSEDGKRMFTSIWNAWRGQHDTAISE